MSHHIHGLGISLSNDYMTRGLDRSEAAQKAAVARKKLRAVSREVEAEADTDGIGMDWLVRPGYEAAGYAGSGKKKAEAKQSEGPSEPISVWA